MVCFLVRNHEIDLNTQQFLCSDLGSEEIYRYLIVNLNKYFIKLLDTLCIYKALTGVLNLFLRRMDTLSGEVTLVKLVLPPF